VEHERVAVNNQSTFGILVRNAGVQTIDLSELVVQAWYSLDESSGGPDDCAVGGAKMAPVILAPGESYHDFAVANLAPNPQYWPQCIDRIAGYVVGEVHSRYSAIYLPGSWTVSYPVQR
jgi:hypothetical protein